jgi:hypothetical protein
VSNETFSLTLAPAELFFVTRALGAGSLSLPDNPFWGWSPQEIDDALGKAQDSLAARRYIEVQPNGTIALDAAVAALTGSLVYRDASLLVSRVAVGEPGCTRHIYFASGLIVEQEQQDDGGYRLTALRHPEILNRRLREFLCLVDQTAPPADSFVVSETHFSKAREMAADKEEDVCAAFLETVGAEPPSAHSLAAALTRSESHSALLAVSWEEGEPKRLGCLGFLEGVDGLWLLQLRERGDQSWLMAVPCDASDAGQRIQDLVALAMPR